MIDKIIKRIEANEKIAIFHHQNIDGDSWSSSYGLLLELKKKYPEKEIGWVADESQLKVNFPFLKYNKEVILKDIDDSYLSIIGDTSAINKIMYYDIYKKGKEKICFDHHRNDISIEHDIFWREPEYTASSMQAYEIVKELGIELDEEIAFNLLIGILTDTGNFVFSLGNSKPPRYFSELVDFVTDEKMNDFWNNFRKRTAEDIEVQKLFLEKLQYEGVVSYLYLDNKDQEKFKNPINFKRKIHSIGNIEGYSIWAMFVRGGDSLKMHFRSNGPNVANIAIKYGGGGHIRAAGAKIKYTEDAVKKVLKELNDIA